MLKGDISNYAAPTLLVNFERVLCSKIRLNKKSLLFRSKGMSSKNVDLNYSVVAKLNMMWTRKDIRIFVVSFLSSKNREWIEELLEEAELFYSKLIFFSSTKNLYRYMGIVNTTSEYTDTDESIVREVFPRGIVWSEIEGSL